MKLLFHALAIALAGVGSVRSADANRLAYLDETDPFYPDTKFPKLTTPQWTGERDLATVVTLAIDDMNNNVPRYEEYLRPIIERLKKSLGSAPLSIMSNRADPADPQIQAWLKEGLSIEIHTLAHPCPILAEDNFQKAFDTFHGCVDLFNRVPGNKPVAFRTPCCDSLNTPSPRMFSEIFSKRSAQGQFLTLDSSVFNITTSSDDSIPRELVLEDGKERFTRYLPFPAFTVTVDNYPYPYAINQLIWEMPCMVPSDWEAQNVQGKNNPRTVEDWKRALDISVLKEGTFNMVFHPHGWIRNDQVNDFIDYSERTHGKKVRFLSFAQVDQLLTKELLNGTALRAQDGGDNGVRLIDLNADGFIDVVNGSTARQQTRVWNPEKKSWADFAFPTVLAGRNAKFGIVARNGSPFVIVNADGKARAWQFDEKGWIERPELLSGIEVSKARTRDSWRFLDADLDGRGELFISSEGATEVFTWSEGRKQWEPFTQVFPKRLTLANAEGRDNGLRFVDLDEDGHRDLLLSNEQEFGVWLYVKEPFLRYPAGWSRELFRSKRGEKPEVPMIVRAGAQRDNGAWFKKRTLWVQNENTAKLPDLVERVTFDELLNGLQAGAKSPAESLQCIQISPELQVELIAAEPMIEDPVNLAFGPDGRLWVAEMRDYPNGSERGGAVRFLEDLDGDGRMDKATLFAENLKFPSGVHPYRNGVLISAAPDILYLEDRNGDGQADHQEVLYTGFGEWNQQHRVNGFEFGFDNWIYVANGDSGGKVRRPGESESVDLRGRDFRFHLVTGQHEATAGQTQFGRHRDNWGNWFGNANYNWGWHYFFPEHYLVRNPRLALRSNKQFIADYPEGGRTLPAGRPQQRFNDIHTLGYVTSACSLTPNRDSLFGPSFAGSVFISEPAQALIHRVNLAPDGLSFKGSTPPGEENREFLASTDTWFRPCGTRIGPDGALYIADMYRQFIEHPEWIPEDVQKRSDVRAGDHLGRIYRVSPKGTPPLRRPNLDKLQGVELAKALNSPSSWQRDTVQQLIVQQQDRTGLSVLTELAFNESPLVRLQALSTLEGLGALKPEHLVQALQNAEPRLHEHAVRLAESWLRRGEVPDSLRTELVRAAAHPSERVRFQLALSLGEWSDLKARSELLAEIARRDHDQEQIVEAILSSAVQIEKPLFSKVISQEKPNQKLVQTLMQMMVAAGHESILQALARELLERFSGQEWELRALAVLAKRADGQEHWERVRAEARKVLANSQASLETRLAMLNFAVPADAERLAGLASPASPPALRRAALQRLKELAPDKIASAIWERWKSAPPDLRASMITMLLSNTAHTSELLGRLERGDIAPSDISPPFRKSLIEHDQAEIKLRAAKLFALGTGARSEVIARYVSEVKQSGGDSLRGRDLFDQHCAICHKAGDLGLGEGPNLATLEDDSMEVLLTALFDPNSAVEDKYRSYHFTTKAGEDFTGIIIEETGNSLKVMTATGQQQTILRAEIDRVAAGTVSLMPEGFEQLLNPADVRDLLAFIKSSRLPEN